MPSPYLAEDLKRDEGLRYQAYPDPESPLAKRLAQNIARSEKGQAPLPTAGLAGDPWTIGYAHTGPDVHEGLTWTLAQAQTALAADIAKACKGLDAVLPWWRELDEIRQDVLANMAFNLGPAKLATFHAFLALVKAHDWLGAAQDVETHTLWARQVGERAWRLAEQMRTGMRAWR